MRLAYLCADRGVPVAGTKGASVHLRSVVTALERRGHQVPVLAASTADVEALDLAVRDIGFDRDLKRLRRQLEEKTGDRSLAGELHGLLLNRRTRQELDRLAGEAPLDGLYERYSLWCWEGLRFARARRLPFVLEVNAPLVEEQTAYRGLGLAATAKAVAEEVITGADVVVVPAAELISHLRDDVGRQGPIEVVPNGIDAELFLRPGSPPETGWVPNDSNFVVAFLGSLKPWHGIDVLLAAFERLVDECPSSQLLVVGDGPLAGLVGEAARRSGRGRIHATGAVPHEEVPYWLSLADVGVAPYPELEEFYFSPLKVIEYMAAALPVVASRSGQIAETVEDGRTGLLVEPGDAQALATALAELAAQPERRREMGARARRRALADYGWDRVAERIERLFVTSIEADDPSRPGRTDPAEVPLWI